MTPEFALDWEAMRCDLWPEGCADHAPEISAFFNQSITEPIAVLIARILPDCVVGFAELSLRYDIAAWPARRQDTSKVYTWILRSATKALRGGCFRHAANGRVTVAA